MGVRFAGMSVHRAVVPIMRRTPSLNQVGQLSGGGVGPDTDLPSWQLLMSFNTVQVVPHSSPNKGSSTENPRQPGRYVLHFIGHNVWRSFVFIYISGSTFIFNIFTVRRFFSDKKCGSQELG